MDNFTHSLAGWALGQAGLKAYIGAATHPLLDLQNTYAVQLFSPLSNLWFHNDALFIIDVWLWSGVAFAIGLSRRRERKGGNWRRPAQVALLATVAYISANAGLSIAAKRALIASGAASRPDVVFAGHQPALFWKREMVWREDGRIGRAAYDPVAGIHAVEPAVADNMTDRSPSAREPTIARSSPPCAGR